ncbi:MAG: exopolysaccharide Pel transporter PelG [Magnetococcales bacterium]|nr:exopolysaccharide Pel transporter PelG [Magnetococcales bacterium]
MAGIGFVLRNLTRQDNLMGLLAGFGYSALVATGPWLFTIMALSATLYLGGLVTNFHEQEGFRIIIIYNFAFSLVFSGPVVMVVTRYVADRIYIKDVQKVPGSLIGGLVLLFGTQAPLAGVFYFFAVDLTLVVRLHALTNYFLITGIWLAAVYITALKDYQAVIRTFLIGMAMGTVSNAFLATEYGLAGMLFGFNVGLAIIFFSLCARVFAEYPHEATQVFDFMSHFRKYWALALGGLFFNMASWVDKWIMWFSPHSTPAVGGFPSYSDYDGAMFLAYLSIVPSMATFVLSMETGFFEKYLKFYQDIQKHVSLARIMENHRAMIDSIHGSGRNFLVLQGAISLLAVLMAPQLLGWLGINFLQLSIYRLGVMGSFYHVMVLFLGIVLSYFDFRNQFLMISAVFLASNLILTTVSMKLGFAYYGYGYFGATMITFAVAFLITFKRVVDLPYHTFISQNVSVSKG